MPSTKPEKEMLRCGKKKADSGNVLGRLDAGDGVLVRQCGVRSRSLCLSAAVPGWARRRMRRLGSRRRRARAGQWVVSRLRGARGLVRRWGKDGWLCGARALGLAGARWRLAGSAYDVVLQIVLMRDELTAATAARRQLQNVGVEETNQRPRARQVEHGLGIAVFAMLDVKPVSLG